MSIFVVRLFRPVALKKHLILVLFFACISIAQATHLVGGFLSYRYLGSSGNKNTYKVTLYVYRDCIKDNTPSKVPFDDNITLCVFNNDNSRSLYFNYTLPLVSEKTVDPLGNTTCPETESACLKQGIYEGNITLDNSNLGYHMKWERCCRNTQENLRNSSSNEPDQGQTYYGFIPASSYKNSSPYFLDIPVPFICANDTTTIRNRAIDLDGDSLSYKFTTPWQGASVSGAIKDNCDMNYLQSPNVVYNGGFNSSQPFGPGGYISIDPSNGLTTYKAPTSGRYAVAIEVTEWRNGVAISSIRLDLQILVINCPPNNKPRLSYQGNTKVWTIEAGAKLCKKVTASDKDNDNISLKAFGDIFTGANGFTGTKATMNPSPAFGKGTVSSDFCWDTDCQHARSEPYVITFETVDDGCPFKFLNENVEIYVTPFLPTEKPTGPINVCQNSQGVTYSVPSVAGHSYRWAVFGGTISGDSLQSSVKVNWGPNPTGKVFLYISSANGCIYGPLTLNISLAAAPNKPNISGPDTVCLNSSSSFISSADPGVTYAWTALGGDVLAPANTNTAQVNWTSKGNGWVALTVKNALGCSSPTDTHFVFISHPNTPPIKGPNSVCPNNKNIVYEIVNPPQGSIFSWTISGGTQASGGLGPKISVNWGGLGTGYVKVIEINKFGCKGDTVSLLVKKNHALDGQLPVGDTSICEFSKGLVYFITPVNGETYNWFVTGGTIVSGQGTSVIVVDWGASGTGSVGVQSTAYDSVSGLPCMSAVKARLVNIRPNPVPNPIVGNFELCQTTTLQTYTINGYAGSTFEWELTLPFSGQGKNSINVDVNTFGTFVIRVREITQYGCIGPWDSATLLIHPKPTTSPIVGQDVICNPNLTNYNYSVTGFANSSYVWSVFGGSINGSNTGNSINVNWLNQQNGWVKVIETSEFGCVGDTIQMNIFVDDPGVFARLVTVQPPPAGDELVQFYFELLNAPRYNNKIFIQRRVRGGAGFGTIAAVNPTDLVYVDKTALTDSFSYEYRAVIVNLCGDSIYSGQHTDVLLKGGKNGPFSMQFSFTDYTGWPGGVSSYELYRLLENKSAYQLYKTYSSPSWDTFSNGKEHYGQWYRIKAIENGGLNRESWSNDIKVYYDPVIFIPNAFTPTGDGRNDVFLPNSGGMKTYVMRIYSRWGEKLFETKSTETGWDGIYLGRPVQSGVYIYVIDYTDYRDKQYQAKGTLHLLK